MMSFCFSFSSGRDTYPGPRKICGGNFEHELPYTTYVLSAPPHVTPPSERTVEDDGPGSHEHARMLCATPLL